MASWFRGTRRTVITVAVIVVMSFGSVAYARGWQTTGQVCLSAIITICGGPTYDISNNTWHFTGSIGLGTPTGLSGSIMTGSYSGSSAHGGSATVQGGFGVGGYMGSDGGVTTGAGITTPGASATLNWTW